MYDAGPVQRIERSSERCENRHRLAGVDSSAPVKEPGERSPRKQFENEATPLVDEGRDIENLHDMFTRPARKRLRFGRRAGSVHPARMLERHKIVVYDCGVRFTLEGLTLPQIDV